MSFKINFPIWLYLAVGDGRVNTILSYINFLS